MIALLGAASCAASEDGSLRRPVTEDNGSMTGASGASGGAGQAGSAGNASTGGEAAGGGGSGGTAGAVGMGRSDGGATGGASGSTGTSGPSGKPLGAFFDDFEDGNATSPSWIDADPGLGGMWSVVLEEGNHVFSQSAAVSDWVIAVSGDYRWSNQVVEAKVKFTSAPGMIGIFARLLDTRNYYFLYLDGSNVILRKRVDNSSTNILKVKTITVMDTWYTLKLSVIDTMLAGYLDGTMIVSATDTDLAAGGIAVGTSDGATGAFDDVRVTVP